MKWTIYLINLLGVSFLITGYLMIAYTFLQIMWHEGVLYYEPNIWILSVEVYLIIFSLPVVISHIKDLVINIYKEKVREDEHERKEESFRG